MKKHNLIIICFVIIAVSASLFLPSYLLNRKINRDLGESKEAPNEYYNASVSSLSKAMSERLSFSQKLDLITGEWPREIEELAVSESEYNPSHYVNLAKDYVADLYRSGNYETSLSTDIDNWYTYDTQLFLCTDTTFDTYSAYYWSIVFTKYDQSRMHYILMMDDGSVLCAYACSYGEAVDILSLYLSASDTISAYERENSIFVNYSENLIDAIRMVDNTTNEYTVFFEDDRQNKTEVQNNPNTFFYLSLYESQIARMIERSE